MTEHHERPSRVRWIVFALGCGTSWTLYLHRYTFALIKPKLKEEWGLSKPELGVLDSVFSICYSAFQFPSGLAADILGAHLFLGGLILLWSIALGLHALAPNMRVMAFARGLFGLGQAGAYASLNRVTRTWFPLSTRTTAQGWMAVFSGRIGAASANILFATVLIGLIGLDWRTALGVLAVVGIFQGIAFLLLFRNSPREHPWSNDAEVNLVEDRPPGSPVPKKNDASKTEETKKDDENPQKPPRRSFRELIRRMNRRSILNLFCVNLTSTLSTIADNIYSSWIPLFLYEVHKMKFVEMGIYSALPLLGGACGGAFGGFLNDRLIRRWGNRRWARSLIGLFGKGTAGVLIVTALLTSYDDPHRFCTFLFFVKFFADISLATRWGTVSDIGGNFTASVFGFNNAVAGLGAILAPLMYGAVSHYLGWEAVFIIGGVMYGLCAASWLLIDCTIPLIAEDDEKSPPEK
ncbi:MAG: MFS transporter [Planctomycetes bacterium]|nr:MFS transporter [Planctomycetota bacterium]